MSDLSTDTKGVSLKLKMLQVDTRSTADEYTAPDHSLGESFPGKQCPHKQLSLFQSGFVQRVTQPTVKPSSTLKQCTLR